jgi:protein gp37
MSSESAIEWTDATWNPVRGCTKISPGCKHCYAERFAERFRGVVGHPFEQGFDPRVVPEMLAAPLRWKRPRLIFVNSMSDLFHGNVPSDYIAAVFGVMAAAPRHTFQVLTKRADRMHSWFKWAARRDRVGDGIHCAVTEAFGVPALNAYMTRNDSDELDGRRGEFDHLIDEAPEWPLANVWLGVSVENDFYTHRIEDLQATPAAVRFLSCEPLLGPLPDLNLDDIHWVIVGGESGPGARPMNPDWVRDIREQCRRSQVPFFFKQWGGVLKKNAGRELDGRTWDERPSPRPATAHARQQ